MSQKIKRKKNPLLSIGIIIFALIILATIFVPVLSPYDWTDRDLLHSFEAPSSTHLFGTTEGSQDLFLGIWIGGRTSLFLAIMGVLPYTLFGTLFGILAGYFGKRTGFFISQFMTFIYAMPLLPLIVLLRFFFDYIGLSVSQAIYASIFTYSFFSVPTLYKVVKAETIRINAEEYMKAAEIMGVGKARRIFNHLLPNLSGQIIVASVQFITQIIILELVLFFFGIQFSPDRTPTWGSLIPNLSGPNKFREYYWLWLFPIMTVAITTISLKFISEGLRIAFDPKAEDM